MITVVCAVYVGRIYVSLSIPFSYVAILLLLAATDISKGRFRLRISASGVFPFFQFIYKYQVAAAPYS